MSDVFAECCTFVQKYHFGAKLPLENFNSADQLKLNCEPTLSFQRGRRLNGIIIKKQKEAPRYHEIGIIAVTTHTHCYVLVGGFHWHHCCRCRCLTAFVAAAWRLHRSLVGLRR